MSPKKALLAAMAVCLCMPLAASCTSTPDTSPVTDSPTEEATAPVTELPTPEDTRPAEPAASDLVVVKPGARRSTFRLVFDQNADNPLTAEAGIFREMLLSFTGADIRFADSSGATDSATDQEIVLASAVRPETAAMLAELEEGEFAIRTEAGKTTGTGSVYLAFTTYRSFMACAEYLMDTYYTEEYGLVIPTGLNVTGKGDNYTMITTNIDKLRDPCILIENGVYYAYGTGWSCYKNTSGKLDGSWKYVGTVASVADPATDGGDHWAPEVHKYNGAYYMFTTYRSTVTNRHGCTILKSNSPEGPFVEITGGHITPAEWDSIDGTLYIDPDGQPWMIFVHEWVSAPNNVGTFAAAKLSKDLTHFISEPIELFKANEPRWAAMSVTDGCWMYTTKEGELLMIWSNFDAHGYVVAVARSSNGRLDGEWIHEDKLLYSKYMTGEYDGGHAMIFTDLDGQMYLSFHSPNSPEGDRKEKPVFLAIKEEDGRLVWDKEKE